MKTSITTFEAEGFWTAEAHVDGRFYYASIGERSELEAYEKAAAYVRGVLVRAQRQKEGSA